MQKIKDLWATNKPLVIGVATGVVAVIVTAVVLIAKKLKKTSKGSHTVKRS
jgi:hypothetical protein